VTNRDIKTVEELLDLLFGFWRTSILRTCVDLKIPDHILAGQGTPHDIGREENIDEHRAKVLLDAFCSLGLARLEDGQYRLEPLARTH